MPATYTVFAAPENSWDKSFLKADDPSFLLYKARPLSLLPSAAGALISEADETRKLLTQAKQALARWEQDFRDYEGSGLRYTLRTTSDALGESDEVSALVSAQDLGRKRGQRASRKDKRPSPAQSASAQPAVLELPWLEFLRLRDQASLVQHGGRDDFRREEPKRSTVEQLRSLRREELGRLTSGYAVPTGKMAALQAELDSLQRSQSGSLLTADLNLILSGADDVHRYFESETLCCVLVVVPRTQEAAFLRSYADVTAEYTVGGSKGGDVQVETTTGMGTGNAGDAGGTGDADNAGDSVEHVESATPAEAVAPTAPTNTSGITRPIPCVVPESAAMLKRDDTHSLYSVVCLKHFRETVSQVYRDQRYTVREFTPDPARENASQRQEELTSGVDEARKASQEYRKAHIAALLACASDIAKLAASAEGVLRYGSKFDLLVLESTTPKEKAYRSAVESVFHKLLEKCDRKVYDVDVGAEDAYLPFVMLPLPIAQGPISIRPATSAG